jgi:intein/homing endonuclease
MEGVRLSWHQPAPDGLVRPGYPPNCVVGDTPISIIDGAKKAFRRWYSGELTELVTASGETVRVTPNHPVITTRGWIAARLVHEGDHLIKTPLEVSKSPVEHPYSREAKASEVFAALLHVGVSVRSLPTALGFHGDGAGQEVDTVDVDGGLLHNVMPALPQGSGEHLFTGTALAGLRLRTLQHGLPAVGSASHGVVSGLGPRLPLLRGGDAHALEHGGLPSSDGDASIDEHATDSATMAGQVPSDGQLALALAVSTDDFDLVEVKAVVRSSFDGFVYNFETGHGWYGAHGLIVHNCRCRAEPVIGHLLRNRSLDARSF